MLLKILQKEFIAKDDFQIMPDSEPITFLYNKLVYSIINLKMILLYELTERYEYREKCSFAMTKDHMRRMCMYGQNHIQEKI